MLSLFLNILMPLAFRLFLARLLGNPPPFLALCDTSIGIALALPLHWHWPHVHTCMSWRHTIQHIRHSQIDVALLLTSFFGVLRIGSHNRGSLHGHFGAAALPESDAAFKNRQITKSFIAIASSCHLLLLSAYSLAYPTLVNLPR